MVTDHLLSLTLIFLPCLGADQPEGDTHELPVLCLFSDCNGGRGAEQGMPLSRTVNQQCGAISSSPH